MTFASGSVAVMTESAEPDRPSLVLRRGALADGYSDNEIRGLRRRGSWATLRRGGYLAPASAPLDGYERHLMLIDATLAGLHRPAVVSHVSAAVLHGMALWAVHLGTMHVTREPPASRGRSTSMLCHAAVLDEQDVDPGAWSARDQRGAHRGGRGARGAVRAGRGNGRQRAVARPDDVGRARRHRAPHVGDHWHARGAPRSRVRRRRSESVGESRSRVLLRKAGVPAPDLQVEVLGEVRRSSRTL